MGEVGTVYILHFDQPYYHARHYVGWSGNVIERVNSHLIGRGSKLVNAVVKSGIDFQIAATFDGTRADERRIKKMKNTKRYCPLCKEYLCVTQ